MEQIEDNHVPGAKWEFDEDVAKCFDSMLTRSIPGYEQMRDLVFRLGSQFLRMNSTVVDIGASRGEASSKFIDTYKGSYFHLMEISDAMLKELNARYHDNNRVYISKYDLRKRSGEITQYLLEQAYPRHSQIDLVLGILTLIFVPINHRPSIIQGIHDALAPGGAFLMVEKVMGNSATTQELLVDAYHKYKHDHGYAWEDIERKRAALEGVQVPVSYDTNVDMLKAAGFKVVECFWRHLNFCGYIAIKG
jgi:tRNA (cmo5U34)-methyltransferase